MSEGLSDRVKLGAVLSAGGSAFAEVIKMTAHLPIDYEVVTDRECGAEQNCQNLGIATTRIVDADARAMSSKLAEHFCNRGVFAAILHFSRLVSPELHRAMPCYNVHPSLLPAYPGVSAVKMARVGGARFLGATAHCVDEGTDTGAILAQVVAPVPLNADQQTWNRISFLQKTLVTLVLIEILIEKARGTAGGPLVLNGLVPRSSPFSNPTLTDPVIVAAFLRLQQQFNLVVFDPLT